MMKSFLERIVKCNQLKCKEHQDLFWLLTSGSLSEKLLPKKHFKLIAEYDYDKLYHELLISSVPHIWNSKLRLGKYAEKLVAYYLEKFSSFKLLGNQIQLIEGKTTVGEIDFLLKSDLEWIHLEFAVKYYISIETQETEYWGPNFNDNWSRKKEHLLNKQMKLSSNYKKLLPIGLREYTYRDQATVLGYIFNPIIANTNQWYCTFEEINQLKYKGSYFRVLEKKLDWLFPFRLSEKYMRFEDLKMQNQNDGPKMILVFNQNKIACSWGFLINDHSLKNHTNPL